MTGKASNVEQSAWNKKTAGFTSKVCCEKGDSRKVFDLLKDWERIFSMWIAKDTTENKAINNSRKSKSYTRREM